MDKIYDIIFIGGGPASMSGALYAKQMNLSCLIIEKGEFGGQIATTSCVENYLGVGIISGKELCEKMYNHIKELEIDTISEEVVDMSIHDNIKKVKTHVNEYKCKALVIGMGTEIRRLGIESEKKFIGKGVSYSTLKDSDNFKDKIVGVIGGGNSAIEDAIFLSEKCEKVYLIHRRNEFRGDLGLVERARKTPNIEFVLECRPIEIEGNDCVENLRVLHIPTNTEKDIKLDAIFVAIGRGLVSEIIDKDIERNEQGYIVTNEKMETNIPGVLAIGDIRNTPFRQIITGCSDGAISTLSAFNYIKKLEKEGI